MTEDPIKEIVRRYDRAVVAKGGVSIFGRAFHPVNPLHKSKPGPKPNITPVKGAPMTAAEYRDWREGRKRGLEAKSERARGNRHRANSAAPKPGRLVAGLTGKLGGYMSDME